MSDISLKVFHNCCCSRHIKRLERTRRPSSTSALTLSCWDYRRGRKRRRMRQKKNTGGSESISAYRLTGNLWKGFVLRRELICGRAAETGRKEHKVRPLPVSSSRGNRVWEKHFVWSFVLSIHTLLLNWQNDHHNALRYEYRFVPKIRKGWCHFTCAKEWYLRSSQITNSTKKLGREKDSSDMSEQNCKNHFCRCKYEIHSVVHVHLKSDRPPFQHNTKR